MPQLTAKNLVVTREGHTVLDGVSLSVSPGERVGIVGANGVGKSTLLRALAGDLNVTAGQLTRSPHDLRVAYVKQELESFGDETIEQLLARRTEVSKAEEQLEAAAQAMAGGFTDQSSTQYSKALEFWEAVGASDFPVRSAEVLATVGLSDLRVDQRVSTLSGGQAARLELAVALLHTAPILLLDEPTNNLDARGIALLEDTLLEPRIGVVLVSHDRALLSRVATSIIEIDENARHGVSFSMGWADYLKQREIRRKRAEEEFARYEGERSRLTDQMRREQQWASRGAAGPRGRPRDGDKLSRNKSKARAEGTAGQARRTADRIDRLDKVDKPWEGWDLRLDFPISDRSGDMVAALDDVTVHYDPIRIGPFSCQVAFGDRIAITGDNGAGKSTLLGLITGEIKPSSGTVRLGSSRIVGVLSQERTDQLHGTSLVKAVMNLSERSEEESRSSLAKLGLGADEAERPAHSLSPGERTRGILAAFQLKGVNLMILDEPTNHLDIEAMEQLESALAPYSGTLLVVTHDRQFLDNLTITRTWWISSGGLTEDS